MEENRNLFLKGVMTYGLAMDMYWVAKYILFISSAPVLSSSLVYWLLTLAIPFIAHHVAKRYRHNISERISFFYAWRFGTMLHFFAALIVSFEYSVFYQFIASPGFVASTIGQLTTVLKDSQVSSEMIGLLSRIRIPPTHMAIQRILNNVFHGIVFSIPVAALLYKNNLTGPITENR